MNTGKEAIEVMAAGVAMILLAAALFFTIRNIDIGKGFLSQAATKTESATAQAMSETFDKMVNNPIIVPAAGAYALIGYNEAYVKSITCYICNPEGTIYDSLSESCLKEHMTGDVKVWASFNSADTQYDVYLASELNELTRDEKTMGVPDIKRLLTTYADMIDQIECQTCAEIKTYKDSCIMNGVHNSVKCFKISATYNSGTGKYTIRIKE